MQGVCFRAHPTAMQKKIFSQWMGCARTIWNAKCDDERYMTRFALKFCPIGTYAPIDKKYSQYKTELTPYLAECPSQILRNAATHWCDTYQHFMKGLCGKPRRKKPSERGSVWLTSELFRFEETATGALQLVIGTPKYPVGVLALTRHRSFKIPRSIRIRKALGQYYVSFCYEDDKVLVEQQRSAQEQLVALSRLSYEELAAQTVGLDRGVAIAVQTCTTSYNLSSSQKKNKLTAEQYIKKQQRRLANQKKDSKRWKKTKYNIGKKHQKIQNI
ncbi:transposase, partial [bacterium]|nr:transposase [bacterium]